ncbi:MAG: hypothetical protein LBF97_07095, partial [Elusimicrobiota bacterium]|nr:hypothetical protein [Elusimicrobiota bacterium]
MKSANRYGKDQEILFKKIADHYYNLNLKYVLEIDYNKKIEIENIIKELEVFAQEYPDSNLNYKVYFAFGELYFAKAICIYNKNKIKDEDFENNIKKALYYYEITRKMKGVTKFFVQNIDYRITECYFALDDTKKTFEVINKYPNNYLSLDSLYLLMLNYYMKTSKNISINQEYWEFIKNIIGKINTINMNGYKLKKLDFISGLVDFEME